VLLSGKLTSNKYRNGQVLYHSTTAEQCYNHYVYGTGAAAQIVISLRHCFEKFCPFEPDRSARSDFGAPQVPGRKNFPAKFNLTRHLDGLGKHTISSSA